MDDMAGHSLIEISHALRKGETSSVELVDKALDRIETLNPRLHAISHLLAERARSEAQACDRRRLEEESLGALVGVPLVVKNLIDTTPAVCSASLHFLEGYRPQKDALVVQRLRKAGAVILGVSASDPGAFGIRTLEVIHPQAYRHIVGGSSGGSAAALAMGLCFGALGTDTGGSIRIPSACCLVTGLKPTHGRVSLNGIRPLAWSLDHVGPMARKVGDLAVLQRVLDPGFDRTQKNTNSESLVIGHTPAYYQDAEPEVLDAMSRALEVCQSLGAEVREVTLPLPDEILPVHMEVAVAEIMAYYLQEFPDRIHEFPPIASMVHQLANEQCGYSYVQAKRKSADLRKRVSQMFRKVDFIIVPTLPVLPPLRDAETITIGNTEHDILPGMIRYTMLFDHSGHPALSLPVSVLEPGIGVSVQIVGRHNCDADVVTFSQQLEEALALNIDYGVRA